MASISEMSVASSSAVGTEAAREDMAAESEYSSHEAAEKEYEAQYLGFCPQSFCDGMYNVVLDYTWQHFQVAQDYMKSEFSSVIKEEELHQGSQVFLSKISKFLDKAFDKAETYMLTNIFYVPSEVVLPEDKVQEDFRDFSKDEEDQLDSDIQNLKNRIKALKYLNASLRQEIAQEDLVKQEYKQFLDQLTNIEKTLREAGVADPRESLLFVIEKSNQIAKIINSMKNGDTPGKRLLPEQENAEAMSKKIKPIE